MERQDPDRQIEEAKASFVAHVEELSRRFRGARARIDELRTKLDVSNRIAAHPLLAVGIAFGAGAMLGLLRRPSRKLVVREVTHQGDGEVAKRGALAGVIGAIAMGLIRDLAVSRLSGYARDWYERRHESEQPEIEPFLEH